MLTPSAVTNAKPKAAAYKLTDGRGMYLLVRPDGPPSTTGRQSAGSALEPPIQTA